MDLKLCSRCKKRVAVVFVTRIEGDKSFNEGTRMTKENPKYMTVKDFYKFMFDLE